MSLRLSLLSCLPDRVVRRPVLGRLAKTAAEAFGEAVPRWEGGRFDDRLAEFAAFTAAHTESILMVDQHRPDGAAVKAMQERLYRRARDLGDRVRRLLGVRRPEEALQALEFFYRQIGIEVRGRLEQGTFPEPTRVRTDAAVTSGVRGSVGSTSAVGLAPIQIDHCFFAGRYSESVCRVIGALDAGVVDGLFGGASLEFSQRLTDGSDCCRALISFKGSRR